MQKKLKLILFTAVEYVDESWEGTPLLPRDPYERAVVRIWCDHITKKIIPPFYALLMRESDTDRQQAKDEFLKQLLELTKAMSVKGPFFIGSEFGMVDIMLVPFAIRIDVLKARFYPEDLKKGLLKTIFEKLWNIFEKHWNILEKHWNILEKYWNII